MSDSPILPELPWALWTITALDPHRDARDVGVADRTGRLAKDVCLAYGGVLDDCVDDDEIPGEGPYVEWRVRVPQEQHRPGQVPSVVAALRAALEAELAGELTAWRVAADEDASIGLTIASDLRGLYEDLFRPLEVELLSVRSGAAADLEPLVSGRVLRGGVEAYELAGTYTMWLGEDLDAGDGHHLLLQAGVLLSSDLDDAQPQLLLPRPAGVPFGAVVSSGPLTPQIRPTAGVAGVIARADLVMVSWDAGQLAARLGRALRGLYPQLRQP